MIYITGDCHFDYRKFSNKLFPEGKHLTKEDLMIICGDFGVGPWGDNEREVLYWMNWLEERPFSVAFCDGNHENFDALDAMEVSEWNGGKVHFLRPHVIHLMRGQYYTIGGNTLWVFGGAQSHDISDGILEMDDPLFKKKKKALREAGALFRINHYSWWARELPSKEELREGERTLREHDWKADFIITHCAPTLTQQIMSGGGFKSDFLTDYLDKIRRKTEYRHWYFGHYHGDRDITDKETLIYHNIVELGSGAKCDESLAGKYKNGQRVRFHVEGTEEILEGKILAVNRFGGGLYWGEQPTASIRTDDHRWFRNVAFSDIISGTET